MEKVLDIVIFLLFNAFKEASKTNPSLTYDAFINSLTNGTAR